MVDAAVVRLMLCGASVGGIPVEDAGGQSRDRSYKMQVLAADRPVAFALLWS